MKTITALTFATIGMHTDNAYIALVCAAIVLILITKQFKK